MQTPPLKRFQQKQRISFAYMRMNKRNVLGILSSCLLLAQLTACSSPIIIYDTPLSDAVTDTDTAPITADTEGTETVPVTETLVTETVSETTPVDPQAEGKAALSALRRDDLDGMNILIAAADESAVFGDLFDGENAGSTVLPATRTERTRMVEERYNVRILNYVFEKEAMFQEIKRANLSDIPYVADFYALPYDQVGRYFANGLLLNLRTLPFTDFSANYYDKNAMGALSAGYGVWGAVGDYTFSPENAYAVYFNKDMNEALGLTSPYRQVRDGEWTWETLFTASKAARASVDEDGNAVWGDNLGGLGLEFCEAMFADAAALSITATAAGRTPSLSSDTERISNIVSLLKTGVYNSATAPTKSSYTAELPDDAALFLNGDMLYYCSTLSHLPHWADTATPWGIVPLPKADKAQRSYSTYIGETAVMSVASTNGALEATGTILQALFAASSGAYPDAYLEEALKYYVRDSETVEMLDLICSSMHYDFTSMFASGFSQLNYASRYTIHSAITQNYSVSVVYNNYKANAEKELKTAFPTNR